MPDIKLVIYGSRKNLDEILQGADPDNDPCEFKLDKKHETEGMFDGFDMISVGVSIGSGVTASLLANWLWEKIKGKADKIEINKDIIITKTNAEENIEIAIRRSIKLPKR
ncbi:hypothetical protein ACFL43_00350 [Thermodesulfobacteriota bacterium]